MCVCVCVCVCVRARVCVCGAGGGGEDGVSTKHLILTFYHGNGGTGVYVVE